MDRSETKSTRRSMRVVILTNYFYPETVGAGIWVHQLATELVDRGHKVTVVTSFPSYPTGTIPLAYRRRSHMRERLGGIDVIRTLTYATPSKRFAHRALSFAAFSASSMIGTILERIQADVVYSILPPLTLGLSAYAIALSSNARLVVNIQDIYPDVAVKTGVLKNSRAIRLLEHMERWIYRKADRIVVISEGFRQNLLQKGVPNEKLEVVPNWADPDAIRPGPRHNAFRRELGINGEFVVLYSGGLGYNTDLSSVLIAARLLAGEPFVFLLVGDGVRKPDLQRQAKELGLTNTRFLPFQPLERYPEVLSAADATLVCLDTAATCLSVPSKIYKQMAAGRPIIGIAERGSELDRLIAQSGCGIVVPPDAPEQLSGALKAAAAAPDSFALLGARGRDFLEQECSQFKCTSSIERVLASCSERGGQSEEARA